MSGFRQVYQPTPYACMAAVAAMITGDCIDEVFDFIGHECRERHAGFLEIAGYLISRGYHLGAWARNYRVGRYNIDVCCLARQDNPALLIVNPKRSGENTHAVLWTGRDVLDPEPTNQGRPVQSYVVIEWWPLIRFEG